MSIRINAGSSRLPAGLATCIRFTSASNGRSFSSEASFLLSSHLPTSEQDVKEQAAADHKDEVPKEIRPKRGQSTDESMDERTDESTRAEKRAS